MIIPEGICAIGPHALGSIAEEIILPPTVTTICTYAFRNGYREGPSLKKLVFPKAMNRIDKYAFDRTEWIESFGNSTIIINDQLYQISSLEKMTETITIPEGVSGICENVFSNNIHSRTLHDKRNKMRDNANNIVFPKTVKTIGRAVFGYFNNVKSLAFPSGLEVIEGCAFEYCDSLRDVELPETLLSIGKSAFCFSQITELKIPDNCKKIGNAAFLCCKELVSVELPCDLEYLGSSAFHNCGALKRIVLPSHIDHIGENLISCRDNSIEYIGIKVPTIEKEGHVYYCEPDAKVLMRYKEEMTANKAVYSEPAFPKSFLPVSEDAFERLLETGEYGVSSFIIQINKSKDLVDHEESIIRELTKNSKNLSTEEKLRYITELLIIKVNEGSETIVASSNMEALKKLKEMYPDLPVQFMGRWTKEVFNKDVYIYLIEQGLAKDAKES